MSHLPSPILTIAFGSGSDGETWWRKRCMLERWDTPLVRLVSVSMSLPFQPVSHRFAAPPVLRPYGELRSEVREGRQSRTSRTCLLPSHLSSPCPFQPSSRPTLYPTLHSLHSPFAPGLCEANGMESEGLGEWQVNPDEERRNTVSHSPYQSFPLVFHLVPVVSLALSRSLLRRRTKEVAIISEPIIWLSIR